MIAIGKPPAARVCGKAEAVIAEHHGAHKEHKKSNLASCAAIICVIEYACCRIGNMHTI